MREVVSVLPLVIALLLVTSCAGAERSPLLDTEQGETYVKNVDDWLSLGQVSERQRGILEESRRTGEIPLDDYQAVTDDALECMRDAGIPVTGPTLELDRGIPFISYTHGTPSGMTSDQALELADGCLDMYSLAVQMLWDSVPANIELREAEFAKVKPGILGCLADQGVEVPETAARSEIEGAAITAYIEQSNIDGQPARNCLEGWMR